ncbi:MAG: indole-3-glycerol phosphate synthase TrpC [Candidatus Omnitrophica bacterium]|nr:indole-3-glycerol phosphate synthase TrpC [Candidatus Omnitrophota bacterium]MDD5081053.1 indole-3-glycerol phosphate synthase TrpC [Candidatus Omnitrophota bacterium]MDD5441406.1 indole-3-glycerol phosphate synthase TrpC [Candidatus Omnitrophota bacterium]
MHKILNLILEKKKQEVKVLQGNKDALRSLAAKAPAPLSFKKAVNIENKISFIGKIKQGSPFAGILRPDFSHLALARLYTNCGASAISVATEQEFYLGKLKYIEDIKKEIKIPVLRKDFIIDESQILESRAAGADAVTLIMSIIDESRIKELLEFCRSMNMDAIVEVHTEKELKKVLKSGADIICVNNRNFHTFKIDTSKTIKLAPFIPQGVTLISESGIAEAKEILLFKGAGVKAVMVGEAILKAENMEEKIKELNLKS